MLTRLFSCDMHGVFISFGGCCMNKAFFEQIREADMVLVGIGEEFDEPRIWRQDKEYQSVRKILEDSDQLWAIPALKEYMLKNSYNQVWSALQHLKEFLSEKNYFIVSIASNDIIGKSGFREERVVSPCGGSRKKQCSQGCKKTLQELTTQEEKFLLERIGDKQWKELELGFCPLCGNRMILNNIYAKNYDEDGYLEQWSIYRKWLQGTLNRQLCVLELGVGMEYPSVIRFPFEKAVYFNQKATFIRVNERLYQLTEELKERGISIPQNAIDWLISDVI